VYSEPQRSAGNEADNIPTPTTTYINDGALYDEAGFENTAINAESAYYNDYSIITEQAPASSAAADSATGDYEQIYEQTTNTYESLRDDRESQV